MVLAGQCVPQTLQVEDGDQEVETFGKLRPIQRQNVGPAGMFSQVPRDLQKGGCWARGSPSGVPVGGGGWGGKDPGSSVGQLNGVCRRTLKPGEGWCGGGGVWVCGTPKHNYLICRCKWNLL